MITESKRDGLLALPDALKISTARESLHSPCAAACRRSTVGRCTPKRAGLVSYGPNYPDLFRRAADLVDKILRGAKPADLPVELPTKFNLVVNLTTAKALGLTIPPTLIARADELIE